VCAACDVAVDGDCERAVEMAASALGGLDVVIANAGFAVASRFDELTIADYRRQVETNVFGVLRTVYAALPALRATRGRLALMGSVAGWISTAGASPYSMSKFALRAFAESLRAELVGEGVSVTLLSPGFVASDIRRTDNQGRFHVEAHETVPTWLLVPTPRAARAMVRAIDRRARERVITGHGKLLVWLHRHLPWLIRLGLSASRLERAKSREAGGR
jgi:short-subunit dehydrogenase